MASSERRYSAAEAREILRRAQRQESPQALTKSDEADRLTSKELVETAREVGFTEAQMETAIAEYDGDVELARAQRELRQLSYRRVSGHLIVLLTALSIATLAGAFSGGSMWVAAPWVAWCLLFLLHLRSAVFPEPEALREQARKRLLNQKLKASGKQLGTALTRGATELMSLSAKKIDDVVSRLPKSNDR